MLLSFHSVMFTYHVAPKPNCMRQKKERKIKIIGSRKIYILGLKSSLQIFSEVNISDCENMSVSFVFNYTLSLGSCMHPLDELLIY